MKKIIIGIAISLLATGAFAKIEKCPSPASLNHSHFTKASKVTGKENAWLLIDEKNKFDTKDEWSFGMGEVFAKSQDEALMFGNTQAHLFISLYGGPVEVEDMTICYYFTETLGLFGIAINPPQQVTEDLIKHFKKR